MALLAAMRHVQARACESWHGPKYRERYADKKGLDKNPDSVAESSACAFIPEPCPQGDGQEARERMMDSPTHFPPHGIPKQPAIHPVQARYPSDHTSETLSRRTRAVRRYLRAESPKMREA